MMSETPEEQAWAERMRRVLDEDANHLDEDVAARLGRARRKALKAGARTARAPWFPFPRLRIPVALVSAAAAAALVLAVLRADPPPSLPPLDPEAVEMEILASKDGLDLYADLDFYLWLAAENEDAG